MNREEFMKELRKMSMHTDWNDLKSVQEYNKRAAELRKKLYEDEEKERSE